MARLLVSWFSSHSARPRAARLGSSLLIIALLVAGCGSGAGRSGSSTRQSSAPSSTSTQTGDGTSTTSTSTLPGTGRPPITIGDKNYTEQFVLGDLYREALQAQGYTVDLNQNIGPTQVTLQAMASGSLDMYPEYLNVFDASIAGYRRSFHSESSAYAAAQRYALAHKMQLLLPTPFSDTEALGVTVGYAEANHLHTVRDLTRVAPTLTVAGPPQFQSGHPGLPDLERAYGFTPAGFKDVGLGDQYAALNNGTVQAADVNTTDGQLTSGDYRVLSDPGMVLGWGNVVPVVAARTLNVEGPAFVSTVNRISALLTVPVIRELNALVDVAGQDPAVVAQQFLETHGVIPPTS
jgi:osmoprotectant transport system substrate-binding protein